MTGETYDDPNGENWYTQINGLMKISSFYNSIGMKFPNADKAFQSAANMAIHLGDGEDWSDVMGKKPSSSVDVYNPWVALSAIISNVNNYGDKAEAAALRKQLQDNAVDLIQVSTIKAAKFEKDDGSFGYTWTTSPPNSQGAPVAVPNTVEGDVNGGVIALTGIYGNMCSALGISDKRKG